LQALEVFGDVDIDHRHFDAAGSMRVLSRQRMHDRRAQRMLARRALATPTDRCLERHTVGRAELDAAADGHVVDRDSGVLAEEIIGGLGNRDVLDHRAEHFFRRRAGLARGERCEPLLYVVGQDLERANIELFRRGLDGLRVDAHGTPYSRLSANASAQNAAAPPADAMSIFCASLRQPTNSTNKSLRPPVRCTASRNTSAISEACTRGAWVQRSETSSAASPLSACPSSRK